MTSRSVVFAEPVRTAIGSFGGSLKDGIRPDESKNRRHGQRCPGSRAASVTNNRCERSPGRWRFACHLCAVSLRGNLPYPQRGCSVSLTILSAQSCRR
jgi:hypothetical protein